MKLSDTSPHRETDISDRADLIRCLLAGTHQVQVIENQEFQQSGAKNVQSVENGGETPGGRRLAALAALAVSFALSVVSNLVVEQPRIRLGKISAALMVRSALADAARCPN
jgi:hypothetical protein